MKTGFMRISRHSLFLAFVFVFALAGIVLRLRGLQDQSFWEDELFSAAIILQYPLWPEAGADFFRSVPFAHLMPGDTFWTVKGADQSPPLFELTGKLFAMPLGDAEWVLRLPGALCAAGVLIWLARLAWQRRQQPIGGVYALMLALMSCSGLMVFYAHEARAYSLGVSLCTALTVFFLQRLDKGWQSAPLPGWGEVAVAVAACLTHYSAMVLCVLLLFPCGLQALRQRDWRAAARLCVAPVVALAWMALARAGFQAAQSGQIGWFAHMSYVQALILVGQSLTGKALGWPLCAAMLLALACGAAARPRTDGILHGRCMLALAGVALAYGLIAAYMVFKSRIENVRHLIFILPLLFALTGIAIARISHVGQYGKAVALAMTLVLTAASVWGLGTWRQIEKNDFRGAAHFVLERLRDGDLMLLGPLVNTRQELAYYAGPRSGRHLQLEVISDAQAACQRMGDAARVGIFSPGVHEALLNEMAQTCGASYIIEKAPVRGALAQVWTRR